MTLPSRPRKTGWRGETKQRTPTFTSRTAQVGIHRKRGNTAAKDSVRGMQVLVDVDWLMALGRPIHVARVQQRPPSGTGPEFAATPATLGTVDWFRGYGGGLGRARYAGVCPSVKGWRPPSRQGAKKPTVWTGCDSTGMIGQSVAHDASLPLLTAGVRTPQDPSHPRGLVDSPSGQDERFVERSDCATMYICTCRILSTESHQHHGRCRILGLQRHTRNAPSELSPLP